jgi:hypothetical protein
MKILRWADGDKSIDDRVTWIPINDIMPNSMYYYVTVKII